MVHLLQMVNQFVHQHGTRVNIIQHIQIFIDHHALDRVVQSLDLAIIPLASHFLQFLQGHKMNRWDLLGHRVAGQQFNG